VIAAVPNTGVIQFDIHFSDANGHFDLWNGSDCVFECYWDDPRLRRVNFWRFG
jgi:hypothetical protein